MSSNAKGTKLSKGERESERLNLFPLFQIHDVSTFHYSHITKPKNRLINHVPRILHESVDTERKEVYLKIFVKQVSDCSCAKRCEQYNELYETKLDHLFR